MCTCQGTYHICMSGCEANRSILAGQAHMYLDMAHWHISGLETANHYPDSVDTQRLLDS